jgi:hypothetical protein
MDDDTWYYTPLVVTPALRSELKDAGFKIESLDSVGKDGREVVMVSGPAGWIEALRSMPPTGFADLTVEEYLRGLLGEEYCAMRSVLVLAGFEW